MADPREALAWRSADDEIDLTIVDVKLRPKVALEFLQILLASDPPRIGGAEWIQPGIQIQPARKPFVSVHTIGDICAAGVVIQFIHVDRREASLLKAKSETTAASK